MNSGPWLIGLVVLLALVTLVCCTILTIWIVRGLRRPPAAAPRRPPVTRPTVVLAHGLLGFDEMRLAGQRLEYFRGLADHLQGLGSEVHCPRVPPVAAVDERARRLAAYVQELGAGQVHIIAHSLGGLDARYALSRLGLGARVASLVTIGTPHRGTPLADLGASALESVGIRHLLRLFDLDAEGFFALATDRMARFNEEVPDVEGVRYASVVGVVPLDPLAARRGLSPPVHPLLRLSHRLLEQRGEPSDGLVPQSSQRWGELLAEVEADHWAQVGWSSHFDAAALYGELLQELEPSLPSADRLLAAGT